jgi:hypothetical protein
MKSIYAQALAALESSLKSGSITQEVFDARKASIDALAGDVPAMKAEKSVTSRVKPSETVVRFLHEGDAESNKDAALALVSRIETDLASLNSLWGKKIVTGGDTDKGGKRRGLPVARLVLNVREPGKKTAVETAIAVPAATVPAPAPAPDAVTVPAAPEVTAPAPTAPRSRRNR